MKYSDFIRCVEDRVKERTDSGCKVSVNRVVKNNGCELDGLVIVREGQMVCPTIYINDYYPQYEDGRDMEDVVSEIMLRYDYSLKNICFDYEELGGFSEYSNVKNRIVYRLVNYDKNSELLRDVPHIRMLDLAVVYYCYCGSRNGMSGYAMVRNSHLESWGVTQDVVHKDAVFNTPLILEYLILGMSEALRKMMGRVDSGGECSDDVAQIMDFLDDYDAEYDDDMFVLTNKTMMNGACTMMYSGVLAKIADKVGYDIYILPSSIHELILVPMKENMDVDELKQMVLQVNTDEVSADEVLSDSVYCYSRESGEISIVA